MPRKLLITNNLYIQSSKVTNKWTRTTRKISPVPRFAPTQFIKPENLTQLKTFKYNYEKRRHYPHNGFQQFMDIL